MAKTTSYSTRAMKAQDPRYAKIFGKLGYQTADMTAAQAPAPPARVVRAPEPAPAPVPAPEAADPVAETKVAAVTTADAPPAAASSKPKADKADAPASRKAKALLDAMGSMSFFELKAAAQKILGDKTPAKKAEIIAALEAVKGS